MKISTRTRYGLRFLVYLATQDGQRYVQLNEVAEHESISPKYLEQIIRLLRPAGILHSQRGAKGGYRLSKKPGMITLEQILSFLEGDLHPVACLAPGKPECPGLEECSTAELWQEFEAHVRSFFRSYTLEDLANRKMNREKQKNYVI